MKLVVGLGNPGKEYENTRHNVGYMVLDDYLSEIKWKEKFKALYCIKNIGNEKVLFVKPLTFMNLSGNAVVQFVNYYNIAMDDILVIHDDMDLELGTYKLKKNSSAGGHNGIKSVINSLNSQDFARLKIGISHSKEIETKDYVLGHFSLTEIEKIKKMFNVFDKVIESFVIDGIEKTMNIYNTKKMED